MHLDGKIVHLLIVGNGHDLFVSVLVDDAAHGPVSVANFLGIQADFFQIIEDARC